MDNVILEDTCKNLCKKLLSNLDNKCIICNTNITNGILFIPCSHYLTCNECFKNIDHKCPECRTSIEYFLEYNDSYSKIKKNIKYENFLNSEYNNQQNITDDNYENNYLLYHINNRHIPYNIRITLRRLINAGYNIDTGSYNNYNRRNIMNNNDNINNNYQIYFPRNTSNQGNSSSNNSFNDSDNNFSHRFNTWWSD